jgi:CDP-diacylglycerol pyrophosphatase
VLAGVVAPGLAYDRNVLWQVVSNVCVRGQQALGLPFPCQLVDLKRGFALLRAGRLHFLLMPTARIEGVESPALLAPGAPNFWEYAWEERNRLSEAIGVPLSDDQIGLAVNSAQARTQDQLHIHIGCLRPEVRAALRVYEPETSQVWSKRSFSLAGQKYRIMRVERDTLGAANPFQLLATGIPAAGRDMASQTLVVAGARFGNGGSGFYILSNHSTATDASAGEDLLDYRCSDAGSPGE